MEPSEHERARQPAAQPSAARVMVLSDEAGRAAAVASRLQPEFGSVRTVIGAQSIAEGFDAFEPDVLVLAFGELDEAQRAQRGLSRQRGAVGHAYRMVVLCRDAEQQAAFGLCRQGQFDDFACWDVPDRDALRLVASIRVAYGELCLARPAMPTLGDLLAHLRQLEELEQLIGRLLADTESPGAPEVAERVRPLREPIESALLGSRVLAAKVRRIRPLVFVVDDDPLVRRLIGYALDAQPYELRFARDGLEALSQLRRLRPDVILADVRMPEMDGVSLTQRLKSDPAWVDVPVILMTSAADHETLTSSIDAGAAAFLLKPYTRESLTAKLNKVLGIDAAAG
jgi:CheY-like chemotaxis protein